MVVCSQGSLRFSQSKCQPKGRHISCVLLLIFYPKEWNDVFLVALGYPFPGFRFVMGVPSKWPRLRKHWNLWWPGVPPWLRKPPWLGIKRSNVLPLAWHGIPAREPAAQAENQETGEAAMVDPEDSGFELVPEVIVFMFTRDSLVIIYIYMVGGLEHFLFFHSVGNHHPNWL